MKPKALLVLCCIFIISIFCGCSEDMGAEQDSVNASSTTMLKTNTTTKTATLELPTSFSFEPYTNPELTSSREFDFGGYMLLGRYSVDTMTAEMIPVFDYAMIGTGVNGLEEGNGLYELINLSYETCSPPVDNLSGYNGGYTYPSRSIVEHMYRSRVVYISEDGGRVLNVSILDGGTNERGARLWDQQFDIYEAGEQIYTLHLRERESDDDPPSYIYDHKYYVDPLNLQGYFAYTEKDTLKVLQGYNEKNTKEIDREHRQILRIPNNTNDMMLLDPVENTFAVSFRRLRGGRICDIL